MIITSFSFDTPSLLFSKFVGKLNSREVDISYGRKKLKG